MGLYQVERVQDPLLSTRPTHLLSRFEHRPGSIPRSGELVGVWYPSRRLSRGGVPRTTGLVGGR